MHFNRAHCLCIQHYAFVCLFVTHQPVIQGRGYFNVANYHNGPAMGWQPVQPVFTLMPTEIVWHEVGGSMDGHYYNVCFPQPKPHRF